MASDAEESNWIQASLRGDHAAYEQLVVRYQKMIHSVTYRMTGQMGEAEDLAQEVFVIAWRQLPSFGGRSTFSSWLYRIAVNRCLNWRRGVSRRREAISNWQDHEESARGDSASESAGPVQEAVMQLEPKLRAVIVLTVYEQMSHAEVALAMQCAETTVSWRVSKARKRLRKLLEKSRVDGGVR